MIKRRTTRKTKNKAALQESVGAMLAALGAGGYVQNYRFVAETLGTGKGLQAKLDAAGMNDYQMDFAWPSLKIGLEVNGGQFVRSGHSSPTGLARDAMKINQANFLGWRLFVVTTSMVIDGVSLRQIADFIKLNQL